MKISNRSEGKKKKRATATSRGNACESKHNQYAMTHHVEKQQFFTFEKPFWIRTETRDARSYHPTRALKWNIGIGRKWHFCQWNALNVRAWREAVLSFCAVNVYILKGIVCLHLPVSHYDRSRHNNMLFTLQERPHVLCNYVAKEITSAYMAEWVGLYQHSGYRASLIETINRRWKRLPIIFLSLD